MRKNNKSRNQGHAYNPGEMERLNRIALPARLKCGMCMKNFNQANFSHKQLTDARYQVSTSGKIVTNPKCFKCTGQQVVEIECVMCHKTKGLEGFAKSQRKKPDEARCWDCTAVQVSREPVDERAHDDISKTFLKTEGADGKYPDYWSSVQSNFDASSVGGYENTESADGRRRKDKTSHAGLSDDFQRALKLGSETSGTLIDSESSTSPAMPVQQSTWSEIAGTKSWHTETAPSSNGRPSFNPNSYGKPGTRSASGSAHSFTSSIAERSDSIQMKNGFAKIRAYKPPVVDDGLWDREEDSFSPSDDDDDDDDDYDDCDDDIVI